MRRCRATLTVLSLTLMALLVGGPAAAGGPTSVLLVVPGEGETASLYTTDAAYRTLAEQVGAFGDTGTSGTIDRSATSHGFGPGVTVTWMIHDVVVWRVDRIYSGTDNQIWVSTQVAGETGTIWDRPVVWHTVPDPDALTGLLNRLGLSAGLDPGRRGSAAGSFEVVPDTSSQVSADQQRATAAGTPSETGAPATPGIFWGLGGLTLGVLGAVAVRRLPSRSPNTTGVTPFTADRTSGMDVNDAEPDREPALQPAEELTWPPLRR